MGCMGVCVTATHSRFSFDMGSSGFFNLRKNVALALDNEFGQHYEKLLYCHTEAEFMGFERVANKIAAKKKLDFDVLDFLFQPDTAGSVSYRTCRKIYGVIKDVDFGNKGFRYAAYRHNDYEEFKEFLLECYRHRRKMRWY